MEKLVFKTEKEVFVKLLDGALWSESGRVKAWFDGEKFEATCDGAPITINAVKLTRLCYTSEPFNPDTCPDKAVVVCWDSEDCAVRVLVFWDAKNKRPFDSDGERFGDAWDHYQLIPDDQAPWMVPLRDNLED